MIHSISQAYLIKLGDIIKHPTFGRIEIVFISPKDEVLDDHRMLCKLLDYNNTLKEFSGFNLSLLNFKVFKPKIIKGGKSEG
jgi:hypothetical protein